MSQQWPIGRPLTADLAQPLLPLAFDEHVQLIKAGPAIDAICRKRAVQILTHGHAPEEDLRHDIVRLAYEAKARLNAFTEIVPRGRMNLSPDNAERCMRYVEIAGGLLVALWDRASTAVPEDGQ